MTPTNLDNQNCPSPYILNCIRFNANCTLSFILAQSLSVAFGLRELHRVCSPQASAIRRSP